MITKKIRGSTHIVYATMDECISLVKSGLEQLPTDGLQRLLDRMHDGINPTMCGAVYSKSANVGCPMVESLPKEICT